MARKNAILYQLVYTKMKKTRFYANSYTQKRDFMLHISGFIRQI